MVLYGGTCIETKGEWFHIEIPVWRWEVSGFVWGHCMEIGL